jgi:hypothetical protein
MPRDVFGRCPRTASIAMAIVFAIASLATSLSQVASRLLAEPPPAKEAPAKEAPAKEAPAKEAPAKEAPSREEGLRGGAKAESKKPEESKSPAEQKEAQRKEAEEKAQRDAARKRGEYTFDDLKFEIERGGAFQEEMLTDAIRSLNKKTMRIRGYILPTSVFQQKGIKQFVLVRDNQECCFGPGAMIYDCIIVEMQEGRTADFATRPVTVQGRFEIDPNSYRYSPDGDHYAIFRIKATEVK